MIAPHSLPSSPSPSPYISLRSLTLQKAIDSWIQLWLAPLCRSLTSSSEVTRKNISGHTLQPIFKICPESFWKVVHVLERRTNWSSEYIADAAYQINALIAVIKAGRSLDLVEGDAYTKGELGLRNFLSNRRNCELKIPPF